MTRKSNINIFNLMTEEELNTELKNSNNSRRYYQRIVAMKAISFGMPLINVADLVGVSYRTINRWMHDCSAGGLNGLKPEFNGGRKPQLTIYEKLQFGNILYLNEDLSLSDARDILKNDFGVEYSLTHVLNIANQLGFNYSSVRPEFDESPFNKEEILTDNIDEANITKEDIIINVDEATIKKEIRTPKRFNLKNDKKNEKK